MDHKKCNKDIACEVTNCEYHDKTNYCCAPKIKVGPSFANTSTETICVTFKPCDNC